MAGKFVYESIKLIAFIFNNTVKSLSIIINKYLLAK